MKTQNYNNHSTLKSLTRTHLLFYVTAVFLNLASFAYLCRAIMAASGRSSALLIFTISILFVISYFLFRSFSLRAQDRAIRAEENLRHFVLKGKLLDNNLKLNQIVALRFASDEEFVALAEKAIKENLSNKEIKKAVKNWRADNHRA